MAIIPACVAPAQAAASLRPPVIQPAAAVKNRLYNWKTHWDECVLCGIIMYNMNGGNQPLLKTRPSSPAPIQPGLITVYQGNQALRGYGATPELLNEHHIISISSFFYIHLHAFMLILRITFSSLRMSVATVSIPCCTVQRVELFLLFQKCWTNSFQCAFHYRTQTT